MSSKGFQPIVGYVDTRFEQLASSQEQVFSQTDTGAFSGFLHVLHKERQWLCARRAPMHHSDIPPHVNLLPANTRCIII